ncbi:hypothetical protein NMY3_01759 [Candidatus Nitrosocosmicus oleophilus]|uniref:Uncharacterized protein n=1 Tax=Candidatus Nitrosocosmicus oleophilus TaxID=1353260 RepID=A0A654M8X2_9ARCH|nr:hypothetical protein NMY3_01759 [Candidatus Nitrosocosmicus oleophilus]
MWNCLIFRKSLTWDINAINLIKQKVKRPQSRILDNYLFTIILDIQYKTLKQLTIEGLYMFIGKRLANNYPFSQC